MDKEDKDLNTSILKDNQYVTREEARSVQLLLQTRFDKLGISGGTTGYLEVDIIQNKSNPVKSDRYNLFISDSFDVEVQNFIYFYTQGLLDGIRSSVNLNE